MQSIFSSYAHFPMGYGTAGFRAPANTLHRVMAWSGLVAGLRAQNMGATTGVVITASHNPESDNGCKIVDTTGGMLDQSWEPLATKLVACSTVEELQRQVEAIKGVQAQEGMQAVFVACDTRKSSPELKRLVMQGIRLAGAEPIDLGVLTTPQLHFAVYRKNLGLSFDEQSYYEWMADALVRTVGVDCTLPPLLVDGANGVGAPKFVLLAEAVRNKGVKWDVTVVNHPGDGGLNDCAGSEHVQKTKTPPQSIRAGTGSNRYASFDGDADRLVLFFFSPDGQMCLLDGDKISALLGGFIQKLVRESGLNLQVDIVQTAYANGASTKYMKETLGVSVSMAKTGVKHLHHKAEHADIGVYFEANGHGTVIFSEKARKAIAVVAAAGNPAGLTLSALTDLINPAVGDAMSDLLAVQAALLLTATSLPAWAAIYADLPSVMTKEMVPDRSRFVPNDDETRTLQPEGLQNEIDALVAQVEQGRAFVRPSGTEDCVRVYAEAAQQEAANKLAADVGAAVQKYAIMQTPQ